MNKEDLFYLREAFEDLLNYEADDLNDPIDPLTYKTPEGDSCLHLAAQRGDLRAARLLVFAGVDVNTRGDMGSTPLHLACQADKVEMIDLLIKLGADKSLVDEFGRPPAFR